jgi:hypothetical protein
MDSTARAQVRLILDDLVIRTKKATETRIKRIYAKKNAAGMLRSGSTIKSVVIAVEEIAAGFVTACIDQVAPVAKDTEAFAMVQESIEGLLRFMGGIVNEAIHTATARDLNSSPAIFSAANELWGASKEALHRQLEIHRYSFTVPHKGEVDRILHAPAAKKNRGGKPLAAHWDELWAAIAVKLYNGDLQPKTQADIERTMKDWLIANELDASDSAVRERARALWRKLESKE